MTSTWAISSWRVCFPPYDWAVQGHGPWDVPAFSVEAWDADHPLPRVSLRDRLADLFRQSVVVEPASCPLLILAPVRAGERADVVRWTVPASCPSLDDWTVRP
jgi:hypothetical protein